MQTGDWRTTGTQPIAQSKPLEAKGHLFGKAALYSSLLDLYLLKHLKTTFKLCCFMAETWASCILNYLPCFL